MRRSLRFLILGLALMGTGTFASHASADAKTEKAAKKAQSDAMDNDFLAADYKSAKKKLKGAIEQCGETNCSDAIIATLHRDLGIVLINDKNAKEGAAEFEKAFAADAAVALPKDFASPDVTKAWDAAKKKAGGSKKPKKGDDDDDTPKKPKKPAGDDDDDTPKKPKKPAGDDDDDTPKKPKKPAVSPEAEGNLTISVKKAPVGYVLPLIVEMPDGLDVDVVKVSYKTASMDKYKTLTAAKEGGKFFVKIECIDTQFVSDIKIYARAYDSDKNEVDHFGTLKKPHVISLVDKLPEDVEAPTFPGGKEADKCTDKADCQPGFPCDKGSRKPQGSGCEADSECEEGLACVENENGKKWCYDNGSGGGGGGGGGGGDGDKGKKKARKIWIGADIQLDFLFLGSEDDACNQTTWACTAQTSNGKQDVGVAASSGVALQQGGGGKTGSGPALATFRFFASFDYFVTPSLSLGARLGFAVNGNDSSLTPFMPFHGEARLQYFLGDPKKSFRPYLLAGGGVGEFDAAVPGLTVLVDPSPQNDTNPNGKNVTNVDSGVACTPTNKAYPNCTLSNVKAYRLAGIGFAEVGGGFWYMLGERVALNVGLKLLFPLPTFSFGFAPEAGIKFGF